MAMLQTIMHLMPGPISAPGAFCSEINMAQEDQYLQSLQTISNFSINGNTLTLFTPGEPLTFTAVVLAPFNE